MSTGQTKIMGIVNINDDSFFAASRASTADLFCRRVDFLLDSGADIIDIGACSSRPGAVEVPAEEEWRRLEPVLEAAAARYAGYSFSIDTYRPSTVIMAYQTIGRFIVNDISSGEWDDAMLPVVGRLGLRYVAMHHQGTFSTMHDEYHYDDVTRAVLDYFRNFSERAKEAGIEQWILDPGFGFSKSTEDCLALLDNLARFRIFHRPILAGVSNKRMTGGDTKKYEALAIERGASIIRTHLG